MGSSNFFNFISLSCFFSFFFFLDRSVSSAFVPVDNFLFDCGETKTSKLEDGRIFEPDSKNSNLGLSPNSDIVVSDTTVNLEHSSLYKTARVFKVTSIYTIKTRQIGRHWLRLHFYPVNDPHYDLKSSVFSVIANGIILFHEFSFSKSSKNQTHIIKEFVINVGSSSSNSLVLTFSPSEKSIAFINGIEVISVPNKLFPSSITPIPLAHQIKISNHTAFETIYRVNMGGPPLMAKNDTLWRTWVSDQQFLVHPASARNISVNPSLIKYPTGTSVEVAPNSVYSTAQEMAEANVSDQRFNISWVFEVDHGFSYFIRLHFCDFISQSLRNLVFNVYIDNHPAINSLDLSTRTNELSAAYYIDFVSKASRHSDKILVQVGPPTMRNHPPNAILNGLEIMKISNTKNSLDPAFLTDHTSIKTHKKNKVVMILVIVCSIVGSAILMLIIAVSYLYFQRPKKQNPDHSIWLSLPTHAGNSESKVSVRSYSSISPSFGLGRVLSFSEIREATKNFDENLVLGVGGFGKVYKGVLENGVIVAIKRGNSRSQQGLVEFRTEIAMLSQLRHRHLVSLIGYCEELNEMILVYEFMAKGPLRNHLYGSDLPSLSWKQRLEICIGAAKGLHYLHTGASDSIIHRDVKTTNILLDENFTAKVADFGLSKLGPTLDQTHVSTAVKGSFGYLDPEYYRRQQLTEKSDVYSFGVVLLEVLCARPAINPSLPREQKNIAEWAMHWQKKGQLEKLIDPHLIGLVNLDSLRKFGETAKKCLAEYGTDRPTMGDVLWNLEYALQLQEASTLSVAESNSENHIPDLPDSIPRMESVDRDSEEMSVN